MNAGVLLVSLGGPRTRGEVPVFLRKFTGRELPPAVMQEISARYDLIGGRSPLDPITEEQAAALQGQLGEGFRCAAAFRHSEPSIERQIDAMRGFGVTTLVFLVVSPYYASVTTGNHLSHAKAHLAQAGWDCDFLFVHSWCDSPFFLSAWADKISAEGLDPGATYLFSAHSLPARLSDEPYRAQIERTADAIAARLSLPHWALGWQSVPTGAREPWIGPQVEEVMDRLRAEGVRKVVQVPIGFTADHIESLYDLDILHRQHAEKIGLEWHRVFSLNAYPPFVRALAQVVDDAIAHPERHRS
jgi:ferrochelatase